MLKNITLSAEHSLIEEAREQARKSKKSLNDLFREWLKTFLGKGRSEKDFSDLMKRFSYAKPGKKFSRDELNER